MRLFLSKHTPRPALNPHTERWGDRFQAECRLGHRPVPGIRKISSLKARPCPFLRAVLSLCTYGRWPFDRRSMSRLMVRRSKAHGGLGAGSRRRRTRVSAAGTASKGPAVKGAAVGPSQGYSVYRVQVPLSKDGWGYHYTRAHPSMRLEVLDRIEVGENTLLAELRMMGPGAYDWPAESRRFPNVIHIETHPEGPSSVLYRVTYRTPSIHTITRRHGVLTRYPIIVQNGQSQFETFAEHDQMRAYLNELRRRVGAGQVVAVQQGSVTSQSLGLTPAQVTIFQEAVTAGFFQVPRQITLTRLAERLGRSKSTISTALVRIRKTLAESALRLDLSAFQTALSVGLPSA